MNAKRVSRAHSFSPHAQKRGQIKLSFGMIFSIILIVLFISFAFYAIGKFFDVQNSVQVGKFSNDLQNDVDKLWKGSQGSQEQEYLLPTKIKYVCFVDYGINDGARGANRDFYSEYERIYENENMFFYPFGSSEGSDFVEIKHLSIEKITETNNPLCFENLKGKVALTIKKDFGEALVTIQ
ncbi:MAG: hypothetical protein ABIH49_02795 [archaeon]